MFPEIIAQRNTANLSITVKAVPLFPANGSNSDALPVRMIVLERNRLDKGGAAPSVHLSEETIEEYLFGRLTQDEASVLEQHVSKCNCCAESLQREKELFAIMRELLRS